MPFSDVDEAAPTETLGKGSGHDSPPIDEGETGGGSATIRDVARRRWAAGARKTPLTPVQACDDLLS